VVRILFEAGVAAALAWAALAKLRRPRVSAAGLGSFGLRRPGPALGAVVALAALELALAAGLVAGLDAAAWAAAALLCAFALAVAAALLAGRAGAPCACFGARSQVGRVALLRAFGLAALAAAVPVLPDGAASTETWLGLGLGVALAGVAALAVAVAALGREIGVLRARLAPDAALDVPEEGPPLGTSVPSLAERARPEAQTRLVLGVFSSEGCPLCVALRPAVARFGRDPLVALAELDEHADAAVWRELGVPGSPYAVAASREGTVLAKGTFNSPAQLEGVLAAAERRTHGALAAA
jgi:hypothetical protein